MHLLCSYGTLLDALILLQDGCRVGRLGHQGVDKRVNFGVLARHCLMFLRLLILNFVHIFLARNAFVAFIKDPLLRLHGCLTNDLRRHALCRASVAVRLEVACGMRPH